MNTLYDLSENDLTLDEIAHKNMIEKAAKTLAEQFDYPWEHMPEQGRDNMRRIASLVIADAVAEERERCAKIAWAEFADVCKKKGLNPCEKHNADWLVSGAIREGANHAE